MRRSKRRVPGRLAWLICAIAVVRVAAAEPENATEPPKEPTTGEKTDATATPAGKETRLSEIVVEAPPVYSAASSDEINAERFQLRPHTRMIQILNNIPGLVVAQHQGGNKAPQYFLRGFDADHGTDVAVFVDDVPVNMVTHAHG